jgi:hypothetical protein
LRSALDKSSAVASASSIIYHVDIMAQKFWIQNAIKKKGALRKSTKTKKGKNIPKSTLKKLSKKKGKTGARARLAMTLARFRRSRKS